MSKGKAITFVLFLLFLFAVSRSRPLNHAVEINTTRSLPSECIYTIEIITSCSSPDHTSDIISLYFGDEYDNKVYIPRLGDPHSSVFERCNQDTFEITDKCVDQVCYLYVKRTGNDGWKPQFITVSQQYVNTTELKADGFVPITFNFDGYVPDDLWYGFNECPDVSA